MQKKIYRTVVVKLIIFCDGKNKYLPTLYYIELPTYCVCTYYIIICYDLININNKK